MYILLLLHISIHENIMHVLLYPTCSSGPGLGIPYLAMLALGKLVLRCFHRTKARFITGGRGTMQELELIMFFWGGVMMVRNQDFRVMLHGTC